MAQPSDIIRFVEQRTGHPLHEDEAITFGPRSPSLTGVTVAWTVDADSIAAAVAAGHTGLVHHEALTFPYPSFTRDSERHYLSWPTNMRRLSMLAKHELTTIRLHGSLDELYIFDAFAEQLAMGQMVGQGGRGLERYYTKAFASPVPTFGELIEQVKGATGLSGLRTTCEPADRPVRRIGLPWGGMGLFVNVGVMQGLIDLGVDTLICGETDNYGLRFAAEAGVAVIETSHEVSEHAGLARFTEALGRDLNLDVRLADTPCIWRTG